MKTAFVTGGGGDLGAAIAGLATSQGYKVAVVDLELARAQAVASGLAGAVPLQADVTDETSVARALEAFGHVPDLLVNNAGFVRFGPIIDMPFADFRRGIEVNLIGAHICSVLAARGMIKRGSGVIVNMASIAGVTPNPNGGAYAAAKAGLMQHTKLLAIEWGPHGLRVNAVAPGIIDAGMSAPFLKEPVVRAARISAIPTRRLGTADDVAATVMFLASDAASYISGQTIVVDGAFSDNLLAVMPREPPGHRY